MAAVSIPAPATPDAKFLGRPLASGFSHCRPAHLKGPSKVMFFSKLLMLGVTPARLSLGFFSLGLIALAAIGGFK
ncbi:hypothetical protein [Leifsonia sp. NCR5]|uniref:hypothetical protein n=1 Tax=Leifsonia sp. NCR5 TaxID=1978342 RepID=UPI00117AD37D|nr:hypothetical protein [Leifsonia sp. NCR5]